MEMKNWKYILLFVVGVAIFATSFWLAGIARRLGITTSYLYPWTRLTDGDALAMVSWICLVIGAILLAYSTVYPLVDFFEKHEKYKKQKIS